MILDLFSWWLFFTDSIMVNHHLITIWENIFGTCSKHLKQIQVIYTYLFLFYLGKTNKAKIDQTSPCWRFEQFSRWHKVHFAGFIVASFFFQCTIYWVDASWNPFGETGCFSRAGPWVSGLQGFWGGCGDELQVFFQMLKKVWRIFQ